MTNNNYTQNSILDKTRLKEELINIINCFPVRWSTKIRQSSLLMSSINNYTPLLQSSEFEYSLPTKIYWILHDLENFPIYTCPVDGVTKVLSNVNVESLDKGYDKYLSSPGCCSSCIRKNPIVQKKCQETNIQRHGVLWYNNSQKAVRTSKERHGDKLQSLIKKREETCLKLYGRKDGGNSEQANKKRIQTNINHWGVDHISRSQEIKDRKKITYTKHFGVENYTQSEQYHKTKKHKYHSEKYPELTFDSTWEVKVYEFCKDNNIGVEYSPSISFEYEYNGKKYTYHPDFLINGKLYEVKGEQFFRINESTGKEEMFCPYRRKEWSDDQYTLVCAIYKEKHKCMLLNNVTILRKTNIDNISYDMFT